MSVPAPLPGCSCGWPDVDCATGAEFVYDCERWREQLTPCDHTDGWVGTCKWCRLQAHLALTRIGER